MYLFSEAKAGTGYVSFSLHEPMTRWYFIVASIDHQLQTAIKTSHQLETISIEHAQEVELELLRPSVYMHFYRHQYSTIIALSSSPVHQVAFGFQWFSHGFSSNPITFVDARNKAQSVGFSYVSIKANQISTTIVLEGVDDRVCKYPP